MILKEDIFFRKMFIVTEYAAFNIIWNWVRFAPWNWFKTSSKIFLPTVPRRYFFCGPFVFLCLLFFMHLHLFIAALWSPAGKWLTSWFLLVTFIVFVLLSHVVSWDRCGTWLYRFQIFASFFILIKTFEPVHEISNNVVCATSKVSDQPAHTRSLIRAFASRLSILWILSYWPYVIWSF